MRLGSGVLADRWERYKEIAGVGYGLSAVCKAALLAVGSSVGGVSAVVLVDRVGKGIRTAPRDALISLSTAPERLGAAFGVHRAMDTAGAMLGPLLAFGVLLASPGQFDAVFAVSLCFAILGLAVLRAVRAEPVRAARRGARSSGRACARPSSCCGCGGTGTSWCWARCWGSRRSATRSSTSGCSAAWTSTSRPSRCCSWAARASFMLLAVPIGRLADRFGRERMFLAGYALLLVVYTALLVPNLGTPMLIGYLVLLGAYYAATDGVLMAAASSLLPEQSQASGTGAAGRGRDRWPSWPQRSSSGSCGRPRGWAWRRWSSGAGWRSPWSWPSRSSESAARLMPKRGLAFVAIVFGCVLLGGGWVLVSSKDASTTSDARRWSWPPMGRPTTESSSGRRVKLGGELLVRSVDPKDPRLNGRWRGWRSVRASRPARPAGSRASGCTWPPARACASRWRRPASSTGHGSSTAATTFATS